MHQITTLAFPHFTRYEGTAPGTTTLHISGQPGGLGAGRHGQLIPTAGHPLWWNPYQDFTSLKGLGDISSDMSPRWDLLALGFGLSFAAVIGYSYWKHRKKK